MKRRCGSLPSEVASIDGTLVEDPCHEDVGCMALEMKKRMKLDATKSLHERRDSVPKTLEESTILAPERATGLVGHKG